MAGRTGYTAPTASQSPNGPAQMTTIYTHFDALIDASVATAASLPAASNFKGRQFFVEDTQTLQISTGSAWIIVGGNVLTVAPAYQSGWSLQSGSVNRCGRWIELPATFQKTSAIANNDLIGTLPAGSRPASIITTPAGMHGVSSYNLSLVQVATTGEIRVFFNGANSETRLSIQMRFPI